MDNINIGNKTFTIDDLDETGKAHLTSLKFVEGKLQELSNMIAALNMAKNGYINELKKEIIMAKSGL